MLACDVDLSSWAPGIVVCSRYGLWYLERLGFSLRKILDLLCVIPCLGVGESEDGESGVILFLRLSSGPSHSQDKLKRSHAVALPRPPPGLYLDEGTGRANGPSQKSWPLCLLTPLWHLSQVQSVPSTAARACKAACSLPTKSASVTPSGSSLSRAISGVHAPS